MNTYRLLLVAEVGVDDMRTVDEVLDEFREKVLPSKRHHITLFKATRGDIVKLAAEPGDPWPEPAPVCCYCEELILNGERFEIATAGLCHRNCMK